MKIALIQVPAEASELWTVNAIPELLKDCDGVDLAVLPECLPFWKGTVEISDAREQLRAIANGRPPFICGGYVQDAAGRRNAAFLVADRRVQGEYFKQERWSERIVAGEAIVRFSLPNNSAVIPLICADAGSIELAPKFVQRMAMIIECGAGPDTPIVVPTYGAGLTRPFWLEPLKTLAKGTGAPVVACGFAGTDGQIHEEDGVPVPWGHGGSCIVTPDGKVSFQYAAAGTVIVDTRKPHAKPPRFVESSWRRSQSASPPLVRSETG